MCSRNPECPVPIAEIGDVFSLKLSSGIRCLHCGEPNQWTALFDLTITYIGDLEMDNEIWHIFALVEEVRCQKCNAYIKAYQSPCRSVKQSQEEINNAREKSDDIHRRRYSAKRLWHRIFKTGNS